MVIGIDASRAFLKDRAGTENYSYELIREILKLKESEKHKFRLYVRGEARVDEVMEKKNVEVVEINWPRLWTQGGLAFECLKRPPDVLFIPAHTLPVLRAPRLKTVVTIHGLEYEYLPEYYKFPQKLYLNKSTEYAVKQATRLIAVSKWTKDQLVERLGAEPKKIAVIHEGLGARFVEAKIEGMNKKFLRQVKHKYGLADRYLLFVGTIQPRKNLVRLIEAFSKTVRTDPAVFSGLQLVIAGKKGWLYEEIFKAPKKFGVSKRVKFIGRVADPDLPAVYSMAKAFVWPSLMEGFGLPVLEAMAMGLPVITSNRGALKEVVGKAALQIDPEDVPGLAEAMRLVLESSELRQGLRERGFGQAFKFSWGKAAFQTLKLLTSVVK